MLTRLLVSRLLVNIVNIAYIKIWVHLTFVLVHLRKKLGAPVHPRAVTIHQTHDSVRITIFDPRFGSYHDFFVGGGRKKKKDF